MTSINKFGIGDYVEFTNIKKEILYGFIYHIKINTYQRKASKFRPEHSEMVGSPHYRILGHSECVPEKDIISLATLPPKAEPIPKKTKTCHGCKTEKLFDEFYKNSNCKDGLASQCKICAKQYEKQKPQKINRKFARW